ncbi:MAG: EAL domain-containing protein [Spirochaetales bacterium]|nr:EAL domain-containing protein [Spirochaetales bacterium]
MFHPEFDSDAVRALANGAFVPYFQPQYNYETGAMTGAEVLVRWIKDDGGIKNPGDFIPAFEKDGFIYEMDKNIWDKACACLSGWRKEGISLNHISVNVSRVDFYHEDLADKLVSTIRKHRLDPSDMHLEVTESAFAEDSNQFIEVLEKLREMGFAIEMDDFGSGYSSLCTLKDIPVDVIKMDSDFLSSEDKYRRCGKIVTAVVRLAHAIDIPVIAEGVETRSQCDFLKTVGCRFMQGFLFAHPMDAESFGELLRSGAGAFDALPSEKDNGSLDFFDISSQSTLIFNSYVGGAAILSMDADGKVSALRMNDKFFEMIGVDRKSYAGRQYDLAKGLSRETVGAFLNAMADSERTGKEESCITCSKNIDGKGRDFWSYNKLRFLSRKVQSSIFYMSIEDISDKVELLYRNRQLMNEIREREELFKRAAEQIDLYFWKYDIRTKEMHPCFRCQGVLGLPELVKDYPDSVIGMCIFPDGDQYRQIMQRVDRGEDVDVVLPLTNDRIPYRIKYKVERDDQDNPVYAYGTAIPAKATEM